MSIIYDKEREVFSLNTPNTTYLIGLMDHRYVGHIYYGDRLETTQGAYLMVPRSFREEEGRSELFQRGTL